MTTQDRTHAKLRRTVRWALLPVIAMTALTAGLPAAYAWDQQATSAQMDNELNWRAAGGTGFDGAYAQAPARHVAPRMQRMYR